MSKTKKKSSAAKKAAIFFAVIIIIEILAMVGISRVFKNDDVTPSIAGYSVFLMDSNRMGDAVPKNSLVLAENVSPSKDKIGKAVLCENVPSIGTSVFCRMLLQRVIMLTELFTRFIRETILKTFMRLKPRML